MPRKFILAATVLLLAILVSYSSFFTSEFHVSEYPTVRDNASIRTLTNLPRFFVDTSTASTIPTGNPYRPMVTASLAFDYFLGKGSPLVFHATNFLIFLACLAVICWLFWFVFESTIPNPWNPFLALFATALIGLHPASVQIVNSISQRGELLAVLSVVSGIAVYARFPAKRGLCLYLLPPLLGLLAHPSALIFAPLLLAYMVLIEPPPADQEAITPEQMKSRDETQAAAVQAKSGASTRVRIRRRKHPFRRYVKVQFRRFAPALAFTVVVCALVWWFTPAEAHTPGESLGRYWFTQPWIAMKYFGAFFAPFQLSVASDLTAFTTFDYRAVLGAVFLLTLVTLALILASNRSLRPAVFGIWWFLIGIAPGAVLLQSEVESDRRMFLPFIGLALSLVWTARMALAAGVASSKRPFSRLQAIAAGVVLVALAAGTYVRNVVWSTEETLWQDAVRKNPENARSLLNYGLALASKGKNAEAYDYLQRAYRLKPWFGEVQAALASVSAALRHDAEAESHFLQARKMAADEPTSHLPYAEWLEKQGRLKEAIDAYSWASSLAPSDMRPRYSLMRLYKATHDWDNLRRTVEAASQIAPKDAATQSFGETSKHYPDAVTGAERIAQEQPREENYLELAEAYCMTSQFDKCLKTAQKVVKLNPGSAEGYNAVGAAYVALGQLDQGIAAVKKALELKPTLKIAQNNLNTFSALVQVKEQ
jgi:Flp pilus assembly protein TadD